MSAASGLSKASGLTKAQFDQLIEANLKSGDMAPNNDRTWTRVAAEVAAIVMGILVGLRIYGYITDLSIETHVILFMILFVAAMSIAVAKSRYVRDNQGPIGAIVVLCYGKHAATKRGPWWMFAVIAGVVVLLLLLAAMYMFSGPTVVVVSSPPPTPGAPPAPVPRMETCEPPPVKPPVPDIDPRTLTRRRRTLNVPMYGMSLVCNGEVVDSSTIRKVVDHLDLSRLSDCLHNSTNPSVLEQRLSHVTWESSNLPVAHSGDNVYNQMWADMQIVAIIAAANPDRTGILRAYTEQPINFDGPLVSDISMARGVFDAISGGDNETAFETSVEGFTRKFNTRVDEIKANNAWAEKKAYILSKTGTVAGWYLASRLVSAMIGPADVIALEGPTAVVKVAEAMSAITSCR